MIGRLSQGARGGRRTPGDGGPAARYQCGVADASDDVRARLSGLEAARRELHARFEAKLRTTPSLADPAPLGSGPANRHGMPRLPTGQRPEDELPVLDLGDQPETPRERWTLVVDGAVEAPVTLAWEDLLALPQVERAADFHCVTAWSVLDLAWRGAPLDAVLALARPANGATHVMAHGRDGYLTNLPLEEALKDDVLLAHTLQGAPLPTEHGGPARLR